ncbi:unnamed protein product [Coregonus sp. 'balchen']|nr:unnamed protein product [Coregonus sp. 'balchen']
MPSGARMPHQGAPMGPPGPPFGGSPTVRPGLPAPVMEPSRKRPAPSQQVQQQQNVQNRARNEADGHERCPIRSNARIKIRELVPESQAYMDLLAFERKLDQTIMRKRQKRKLRLYISNTFNPAKPDADDSDGSIASWELRVEGKLLDDPGKLKRKFSSFFKSLVIELDKDLYGPDNHLVELLTSKAKWHRTPTTQETDGFQVKRPGDPPQFKLDPRLARLLGIHTQTRSCIIQALWQYVKTNKLQDSHDKEYINCDKYFQQRLTNLLLPPDPIVINHVISVDPNDQKKTACYDIDVEVEDPLKSQMSSFLLSTANQQEIASLDNKIHETIESINQLKIQRDFMLSFSRDPKGYIQDWLKSQSRDLKLMTDVVGNPEEERRAEFYHEPWSQEAVSRYFYSKIQQRRQELEQALAKQASSKTWRSKRPSRSASAVKEEAAEGCWSRYTIAGLNSWKWTGKNTCQLLMAFMRQRLRKSALTSVHTEARKKSVSTGCFLEMMSISLTCDGTSVFTLIQGIFTSL